MTDKRERMSIIMDYMFCTLIIVAIPVITFIAYLYLSYKYKKADWVTMSTMILIMWFVEGLYLYLTN